MVVWPAGLLCPEEIEPNPVPRSRSGGRTLGGPDRPKQTDTGYWQIGMNNIPLYDTESRRWWNAIRTMLQGRSGLAIIPVWSRDTAPYPTGMFEGPILTTHSDGSPFSDGSMYSQYAIRIKSVGVTPIGAKTIRLQTETSGTELLGTRFSYNHAFYETGLGEKDAGGIWTFPIFPPIRAPIPDASELNFDDPTCLVRMKTDREMDVANNGYLNLRNILWEEATDYWSDKAAGLL